MGLPDTKDGPKGKECDLGDYYFFDHQMITIDSYFDIISLLKFKEFSKVFRDGNRSCSGNFD